MRAADVSDMPAPGGPSVAAAALRVLIVDDHPLVRMGLRSRLALEPWLDLVDDVGSGAEALAVLARRPVDLLLVDISMPGMNGVELIQAAHAACPALRVVVLSMFNNREYIVAAVQCGARGYVLKDAPVEDIIAAIATVAGGGSYYSPPAADVAIGQAPGKPELTAREREVLLLLADGLSNKSIARRLQISPRTVESHRLALRRKLGVDSAAEMLKVAVMYGWTTL
jgi:DNA-binding NarL/FixJ family response regulator